MNLLDNVDSAQQLMVSVPWSIPTHDHSTCGSYYKKGLVMSWYPIMSITNDCGMSLYCLWHILQVFQHADCKQPWRVFVETLPAGKYIAIRHYTDVFTGCACFQTVDWRHLILMMSKVSFYYRGRYWDASMEAELYVYFAMPVKVKCFCSLSTTTLLLESSLIWVTMWSSLSTNWVRSAGWLRSFSSD